MKITKGKIPGVLIIEPDVFGDSRGFFMETWNRKRYEEAAVSGEFVQDNLSRSIRGVVRGLHYQYPHSQAKLVSVLEGEVFDVAVDIRRGSPNFGRWEGIRLSAENKKQFYIPPGFAHGFEVLSDTVLFYYKCTDFYYPEYDRGIRWNDPEIGVTWDTRDPSLSQKDAGTPLLRDLPQDALPVFNG